MTITLDYTNLLKQPSATYNRSHDNKRKIYLYKKINQDKWNEFANKLDNVTSCDQVLNKIHNSSKIILKAHLNCM